MSEEDVLTTTNCRECPVRQKTIFKNVHIRQLNSFQNYRTKQIHVPARTLLFHENEKHENFYTLFSGWGMIYKTVSNNNKRQILRFIFPGDFIGCQANESGVMSHSAAVITQAVLCVFPREDLRRMLKKNSAVAIRLFEMETRDMSICQNHLMATGRKSAKESISFLLMELFYRVRNQIPDSYFYSTNTIDFPITQEDIGDAVGLTKIHVNRVIKELIGNKLINIHKKQLIILNEKKLSEIAGFKPDEITGQTLI